VAQLIEASRNKLGGHGFVFHRLILLAALWLTLSLTNEHRAFFLGDRGIQCVGVTT